MRFETEYGAIGISGEAIAAVAAEAARSCFGVKGMGTGGPLAQLVGWESRPSVAVHPAEGGVRLELHISAGYGVNIPQVGSSIISSVGYHVALGAGVDVVGVDLFVDAIRP